MEIKLRSLTLRNFKGIKDLTISDLNEEVNIKGRNTTGKTTIMDAWLFLLFGKDSSGRTDFNIKTLDPLTGEPYHRLEHEVSANILVDGEFITLKKIYKEKWTKPRGAKEEVFSGHETEHYYNDVPLAQRDYNNKIEALCPERIFKLITNPMAFTSLPWQEQRKMLFDIAGEIDEQEIASRNPAWMTIAKTINAHKTMEEYRREIAMKKKRIKEELEQIPARMDEVQRGMPSAEDWTALTKELSQRQEAVKAIDKEISDLSAVINKEFEAYREKQREINNKKIRLDNISASAAREVRKQHQEYRDRYDELLRSVSAKEKEIAQIKRINEAVLKEKEQYTAEREALIKQWREINSSLVSFDDSSFVCPTCKRAFDEGRIDELKASMTSSFNEDKRLRLERNVASGKLASAKIQQVTETLSVNEADITRLEKEIKSLNEDIAKTDPAEVEAHSAFLDMDLVLKDNTEYHRLKSEIAKMEESLGVEPKKINTLSREVEKEELQNEITSLNNRLSKKGQIESANKRLAQLSEEQQNLSQTLADFEGIEYNIQNFTRAKIEAIEENINSKFSMVSFRMFDQQVNGQSVETCEAMVKGVPFKDINNAAKINAGADIIKTLSDHYEIYVPIFFDNSEACNEIMPLRSQTFKLYVTEDNSLIIN